ncbi:response regulator [Ectothiorhodospiraceae bacterium BW-2]|nr:response regulator [Ectothiorhodospiraceae bacterium BW-2]
MSLKKEILLVEDDLLQIDTIRAIIHTLPSIDKLTVLQSGEEALAYLLPAQPHQPQLESLPNLLLLDLNLPNLSGLEVLKQLRQHSRTELLPIVMFTASGDEACRAEAYRLGVNSFVLKPVDIEQFTRAVAHMAIYWTAVNESDNDDQTQGPLVVL